METSLCIYISRFYRLKDRISRNIDAWIISILSRISYSNLFKSVLGAPRIILAVFNYQLHILQLPVPYEDLDIFQVCHGFDFTVAS